MALAMARLTTSAQQAEGRQFTWELEKSVNQYKVERNGDGDHTVKKKRLASAAPACTQQPATPTRYITLLDHGVLVHLLQLRDHAGAGLLGVHGDVGDAAVLQLVDAPVREQPAVLHTA
jgi:hypothetical protein